MAVKRERKRVKQERAIKHDSLQTRVKQERGLKTVKFEPVRVKREIETPSKTTIRKKESGLGKKESGLEVITKVIKQAEGLTDDCRGMLIAMIPGSLAIPADLRHPLQHAAVEILNKVFSAEHAKLRQAVESEETRISAFDTLRSGIIASLREAEAIRAKAVEQINFSQKTLEEASVEVLAQQAKLCEVHDVERRTHVPLDDGKQIKEALESALALDFIHTEQTAHHIGILADLAQRMSLNSALAKAVPYVLQKDPEARSLFEKQVVEQLHRTLQGRLAQIQSELEVEMPKAAEQVAVVDSFDQELNVALQRQQEAVVALHRAQDQQRQASAAVLEAKLRVSALRQECHSTASPRDELQEELTAFEEGALAVFSLLRDTRISVKCNTSDKANDPQVAAGSGKSKG